MKGKGKDKGGKKGKGRPPMGRTCSDCGGKIDAKGKCSKCGKGGY